eukprot:CAMPEP_0173424552 /NCGR_PEP_ID=MMETSP1357-20121228/4449_1 /TAXON_ID=77926 /ORGANISM="Hemiselmis rufescens, Strain PCC563" /LENGTH=381 /DNA_ID=CAMNT_0014387807 /DNA_START=1 /DNA_END=1146 /DNA_ORIENTATION=-
MMGFLNIDVIDMDTIELTNLNRQFLFRQPDVGSSKAEVAAAFVNKRVPGANVVPHFAKIQDKDGDFYKQFHIIIMGLDSLEARRWMNDLICSFLEYDEDGNIDPSTALTVVDGGTEGLKGHVNVIKPGTTPCFECILPLFPPQVNFPMCTLADVPRTPAHCVEWSKQLEWDRARPFGDVALDCDDADHMQWLFKTSEKRAKEHGIEGVTLKFTQGVAKRIIPAIAATNAVVAAACANEVFKIATGACKEMQIETGGHYMMYVGSEGVYTDTMSHDRDPECTVCHRAAVNVKASRQMLLKDFIGVLKNDARLRIKDPALSAPAPSGLKVLHNPHVSALAKMYAGNLDKTMGELLSGLESGVELTMDDPVLATQKQLSITFTD